MPQAAPYIAQAWAQIGRQVLQQIVISLATAALSKALAKKPNGSDYPINVTVRSTVAERRLVFGTARAGGAIAFAMTSGTKNKYLWYVVVYAGHQVSDIKDLWLDKFLIPDADINAGTGAVSTAALLGKLFVWSYMGTQAQTADANLTAAFPSDWLSTHRLRGCAYRVLRFERNDKAWPMGAPQMVTSLVDGALCYDPRLDTTNGGAGTHRRDDPQTWAFTRNWALILRWYLSGGSVVNDQASRLIMYGLKETDARIDDAYTIAAANVCDQSLSGANAPPSGAQVRYTCDIEVSCAQTRREIIEEILMCGGPGQVIYVHGKWRIYAAAYDAPVHTFTQDDLYGEMETDDTTEDDDRFNTVSSVYIDASREWNQATSKQRTNAAYITQDGAKVLTREFDLRGVTDTYRAQRITERMLRNSRQMRRVKFRFGRQGLKVAPWETFSMSHTRYGWTSRVFRCMERERSFNDDGGMIVVISAVATASSIDTDLVTADYVTGTSVTNSLQSEPPDAPTGLTATTRNGGIEFNWSLDSFWQQNGVSEIWEYTSITPFSSATKIWEGRATRAVIEKLDTTTRYYWVRVATIGGQTSDTEPATNGLAAAAFYPVFATPVIDNPADGNIVYTSGTQPRVEVSGIGSHTTYTSPAGFATRCTVSYAVQADVSNTTSGVAVGYASSQITIQVNGATVFTRETRLEAVLNSADAWAGLVGTKTFDVPAGQAIDVFMNVGRTFSSGGSSPAQTIYWRAAHTEILPSIKS